MKSTTKFLFQTSIKYDGGLIEFVKNGFICKTIPEQTSDKIGSMYRPPVSSNLTIFFEELTKVLSKAVLREHYPPR